MEFQGSLSFPLLPTKELYLSPQVCTLGSLPGLSLDSQAPCYFLQLPKGTASSLNLLNGTASNLSLRRAPTTGHREAQTVLATTAGSDPKSRPFTGPQSGQLSSATDNPEG